MPRPVRMGNVSIFYLMLVGPVRNDEEEYSATYGRFCCASLCAIGGSSTVEVEDCELLQSLASKQSSALSKQPLEALDGSRCCE